MSEFGQSGERGELIADGAGAISICFVGADGIVAGVTRIRVSGPAGVVTRVDLPLSIAVGGEEASVIPYVVYQSNPEQKIRMMGSEHDSASLERSRSFGPSATFGDALQHEWQKCERLYWARGQITDARD